MCTCKEYLHTEGREEALKVKFRVMGILPVVAGEWEKNNANSSRLMCHKFLIMVISDASTLLDFAACYIP